jgi:hypothetical protein
LAEQIGCYLLDAQKANTVPSDDLTACHPMHALP